eukprot:TRINITY_DN8791_c0_g1_i1.p1 TRINITY_DN8791_c0_g1~~TRINITY_DN8791_c0_g1_i1.p1  ORF type:complete len:959 (-),score=179.53 TRINITY_DN8791_c0_g1_i1:185-3061(-)
MVERVSLDSNDFTITIKNNVNNDPDAPTRYVQLDTIDYESFPPPLRREAWPWSSSDTFIGNEFVAHFRRPWPGRGAGSSSSVLVFEKHVAAAVGYKPAEKERYLSVLTYEKHVTGLVAAVIASDVNPLKPQPLSHEAWILRYLCGLSCVDSAPGGAVMPFLCEASNPFLFERARAYVQTGDSLTLQPADWIQCVLRDNDIAYYHSGGYVQRELVVTLGGSPDDVARAGASQAASFVAIAEKKRREMFGADLSDTMRGFGFDDKRFNVGIIGANNTGKSTFANMLLFASHKEKRFNEFVGEAKKMISEMSDLGSTGSAVVAGLVSGWQSQLASYKLHHSKEGRCTTWETLKPHDFSIWFPNATVWDLPGLEAQDGGVHAWAQKASLNFFDALILVCEKQFSTDDFWLLQYARQAIVNGTSKAVPVFLVRSKMDIAIKGEFETFVDEGGKGRDWNLDWEYLSSRLRCDMLNGLEMANEKFKEEDPMLAMSQQGHSLSKHSFFFFGKIEDVRKFEQEEQRIPYSTVQNLHTIFEAQAALIRSRLFGLAKQKFMAVTGSSALSAYGKLEAAILCLEPPYEPPEYEEEEVRIDTGSDLSQIGFGVTHKRGTYYITEPDDDDQPDKRASYNICLDDEDFLLELPVGTAVTVKTFGKKPNLTEQVQKIGKQVFHIIIGKEWKAEPGTFQSSKFSQMYGKHLDVADELYETAVEGVVSHFAKKHGVAKRNIDDFLKLLRSNRAGQSDVEKMALSDWTSQEVLQNDGRSGEAEFCSMLNDALRCDAQPVLAHAIDVLQAFKVELVVDRASRASSKSMLLKIPDNLKDESGILKHKTVFRGTGMPQQSVDLFTEGEKYRVPFFLATSFKRYVAEAFADRSWTHKPSLRKVVFEIDISEMPLHAAFVHACPPAPQGEFEFLFVPYSCFKVTHVDFSHKTYSIKLKAFPCNKEAAGEMAKADSWRLMTWH